MTCGAHLRSRTQQNRRFGKRLRGEIYVASEASATSLRNYAPQISLFEHDLPRKTGPHFSGSCSRQLFRDAKRSIALDSWKRGAIHPSTAIAGRPHPRQFVSRRIATKHLI